MRLFEIARGLLFWYYHVSMIGTTFAGETIRRVRPSVPRIGSSFVPAYDNESAPRMSIANMTCDFFTQPLNHFVPRGKSPSFQQRYCIYDGYASNNTTSPILFYTGNESPLEQYINHTGLMWELAPRLNARVVFVEHRYEGQSLPPANLSKDCMSYGSTIQALADYADILQLHLNPRTATDHPIAPVIAFGGSYGGMLSAWMRMKYPHLIAGAIAASAPIGGFPQVANFNLDGSARVLAHGLQQTYPPDKESEEEENHCSSNLLASWPLITWLVQENRNRAFQYEHNGKIENPSSLLQDVFRLCDPYTSSDPEPLLQFATSLWFDLAEGSFPYPSSYIPFALLHKKVNLPAWPMQAACWTSRLHQDWRIHFQGDVNQVRYNISYGDSGVKLQIDWDNVTMISSETTTLKALATSEDIVGLLSSVREAISIWHNVSKDVQCYNVTDAAPNLNGGEDTGSSRSAWKLFSPDPGSENVQRRLRNAQSVFQEQDEAEICRAKIKQVGSWEPVCCNDEMDLIITEARGLGRDFFWPPSLPRGVVSYDDLMRNVTMEPCPDPDGIFGYSTENYDPWSTWLDTYYGSSRMSGHSNIIFSNGLLDPWAAGGIYAKNPTHELSQKYDGSMVQNITDHDVIALIMEYGGHHTDLMYSHKLDPECVTKARKLEKEYVAKWINEW